MEEKKTKKHINLKIKSETNNKLKLIAEQTGINKFKILEHIINMFYDNKNLEPLLIEYIVNQAQTKRFTQII